MGENLTAGILKQIDMKAEVSLKLASEILTSVKASITILSKEISGELKTQTGLLKGILKAVAGKAKVQKEAKDTPGFGSLFIALSSGSFKKSVSKINAPFATFVDTVERLVNIVNEIDQKKWQAFIELLDIGKKVVMFGVFMVIAAPLLLISLIITLPLLYLWVKFFAHLEAVKDNVQNGAKVLMYLVTATVLTVIAIIMVGS